MKLNQKAANLLAHHAQGSLRDALSLLDQIASLAQTIDEKLVQETLGLPNEQMLNQLLKTLKEGSLKEVLGIYQGFIDQGVDAVILAQALAQIIRHNFQEKNLKEIDLYLNLLEDLLKISQARQPQLALELILLRYALNLKSDG